MFRQSRGACSTLWCLLVLKLNDHPISHQVLIEKVDVDVVILRSCASFPRSVFGCYEVGSSKHLEPAGVQPLLSLNSGQTTFTLPLTWNFMSTHGCNDSPECAPLSP